MDPQDPVALVKIPTNLADEMQQSYMAYAMSVIIGRALPDVRDGLKPANRRVLYGMQQMGLAPGRPYRKSAKIVGEVMGNYHPHGDAAIYDTLVRMAQPFNMRALLVDGQGNFGSVDGDPPAAQRYTEARLTRVGAAMMADIEKDTVDFQPTYDDSSTEPTVLPTVLPNLLVNGSAGIAVGMATNIPPHNVGEVVSGLLFLLENQDLTPDERVEGLLERVPGPDFPTAGFICGRAGIRQAYRTGRGSIVMRARAEIEVRKGDKESIVITEIPYQVNKARLIERIAELVRDKQIEGISDLRDESDRQGMRIVVDVRKGESSQIILNNLYKHTPLQDTFGVIMLAIVEQRPRVLPLLDVCELFIAFRRDVVRRRTAHDLRKAEARAHILEGYAIALDHLDEVIALIRAAKSPEVARAGLVERFSMSEIQAKAVLDLQLQRLTGLERQKIVDELAEIRVLIADLKDILASAQRVDRIVGDELRQIRDDHGDARRTEIVDAVDEITAEELIADEDVAISISHSGYIKRTTLTSYRSQRRGGRGRVGMKTRDEDFVDQLFIASTHSYAQLRGRRLRPAHHPQGHREEDRAGRLLQPAPLRHHRALGRGRRRPHRGGAHHRRRRDPAGHPRGHGHPLQRGGRAPHGPGRLRREGHRAGVGRRGGGPGGGGGGHGADGHRQRLRQEDRPLRVPHAEPGRQGAHQHQDHRPQRSGGGRQAPSSRGRGDAHH
jgi:DNA gyrase subunit A